ncbi:DIRC2 (predicted) [Pycnogonum litorale]
MEKRNIIDGDAKQPLLGSNERYSNVITGYEPSIDGPSNRNDSSEQCDEDVLSEKIVGETPTIRVYKRRWIIIGIFSLLCAMQNGVWNTWGPIAITAESYFNWKDSDIALLNNWGNINVILFIIPAIWLIDTKGVRVTALVSASLMLLSTAVRCITSLDPYALV